MTEGSTEAFQGIADTKDIVEIVATGIGRRIVASSLDRICIEAEPRRRILECRKPVGPLLLGEGIRNRAEHRRDLDRIAIDAKRCVPVVTRIQIPRRAIGRGRGMGGKNPGPLLSDPIAEDLYFSHKRVRR